MIFNQIYTRASFIPFLYAKLFPTFKKDERTLQLTRKTAYFVENKVFQLGTVQLDDRIVYVLEIEQKSSKDPRITLTKDAFKILDDNGIDTAIVVFHTKDNESYRLSLLTTTYEGWDKKSRSSYKRFSYILGPSEKVKTPKKQLTKPIQDYQDLLSRFKVEVVRDDFFERYLELFVRLYKSIKKDTQFVEVLQSQHVDIVSFTKTLIGKIVFLYFIQQKGWLGLGKKETEYGRGDKNFMRKMRENFKSHGESMSSEKTGYFYNDYLERLFYAGLNADRRDNDDRFPNLQMKVPYLNGGLFKEDYQGRESYVAKIDNDVFSNSDTQGDEADGILDIFDMYNFTVDEDSLYDSDIAIDPEMLGRIFEKMISISSENIDEVVELYDNKGKKTKIDFGKALNKKLGAFYTPREIVHYMTQESLIAYLLNTITGDKKHNEQLIRNLFDLKEQFLLHPEDLEKTGFAKDTLNQLEGIIDQIDEALKKVKILDPAVGSGAFPMGLLHEITSIRYYSYGVFHKRFATVVNDYKDETGKISLYKIKRDVILNNIYGVDIDAGAIEIARLRFWLALVVDEDQPEPLPNFEFKFVCANTLIPLDKDTGPQKIAFDQEIDFKGLQSQMKKYFNCETNKQKQEAKNNIEMILGATSQSFDFGTKSLRTQQLETYKPFDPRHSAEFFDPSLMMGHGLFDIVIGNPPYGQLFEGKMKEKIKKLFPEIEFKIDIYNAFILINKKFLNKNGVCYYIIPNTILDNYYSKNIREYILVENTIKEIIDLNDRIFENAVVHSMILGFQNKNNGDYIINVGNFNNLYIKNSIPNQYFLKQENYNFLINAYKYESLIKKFQTNGISLDKIIDIRQTIKTGDDKRYIKGVKEKDNFKPILRGKDIHKYSYTFSELYVDYGTHLANSINKNIFEQPKILIREAGNSIIATYDEDNYYIMSSLYNGIIKNEKYNLKYILALLNSTMIHFFMNIFVFKKVEGAFTKARIFHYNLLFIKEISGQEQQPFIELVDKILINKKENSASDTSTLEKKIDQMVYELYELTEEEIRVVEESVK